MFDYLRVNDPKHQTWGGSHDMVKKKKHANTNEDCGLNQANRGIGNKKPLEFDL